MLIRLLEPLGPGLACEVHEFDSAAVESPGLKEANRCQQLLIFEPIVDLGPTYHRFDVVVEPSSDSRCTAFASEAITSGVERVNR